MPNPSLEPPASFKTPNQDGKDIDVLCTFKIKIEPKFGMDEPTTSDHIQIKTRMPNPSQEPPASSKATNQDFEDMDVLCTSDGTVEAEALTWDLFGWNWKRKQLKQTASASSYSNDYTVLQE